MALMTAQPLRLDERRHVEKPLLDQLAGLGWEILDLDNTQRPADTFRESFAEVLMPPVLRERIGVINPWLDDDQIEEAARRLTAGFPGPGLLECNRHVLDLLLEGTSAGENRRTGEKSPTVRYVDFEQRKNNRFIAVCQCKVHMSERTGDYTLVMRDGYAIRDWVPGRETAPPSGGPRRGQPRGNARAAGGSCLRPETAGDARIGRCI